MNQVTICALCRTNTDLKDSHYIPRFVGDWLKANSANGFIWGTDHPNERRQDLPQSKLLCFDCEQRFSKAKKSFADKVFYLFQKDGTQEFAYED